MSSEKILVFRIGSLGDMVVALPAFWRLRYRFPDAHITLLSNSDETTPGVVSARSVLPESGMFDDFLSYPSDRNKLDSVAHVFSLYRKIRSERFDQIVYLMNRTRTGDQILRDKYFFRSAGIRAFVGMDHLSANRLEVNAPSGSPLVIREGEFLLQCVDDSVTIDSNSEPLRFDLGLTREEVHFSDGWLRVKKAEQGNGSFIGVGPGSKWPSKIWPIERISLTVQRLIEQKNVIPIVFGGHEDREIGDCLITSWGRGINAAGALSIRHAAAALGRCTLYVGNDTGTMHLAAAMGTPCVALFAAIDWPGRWYPWGETSHIFRERVDCEGCHLSVCPFDNKCLKQISVEPVVSACKAVLDS